MLRAQLQVRQGLAARIVGRAATSGPLVPACAGQSRQVRQSRRPRMPLTTPTRSSRPAPCDGPWPQPGGRPSRSTFSVSRLPPRRTREACRRVGTPGPGSQVGADAAFGVAVDSDRAEDLALAAAAHLGAPEHFERGAGGRELGVGRLRRPGGGRHHRGALPGPLRPPQVASALAIRPTSAPTEEERDRPESPAQQHREGCHASVTARRSALPSGTNASRARNTTDAPMRPTAAALTPSMAVESVGIGTDARQERVCHSHQDEGGQEDADGGHDGAGGAGQQVADERGGGEDRPRRELADGDGVEQLLLA